MTAPADHSQDLFVASVLDDVPLSVEESLDSDDLGDTDAGLDPLDDSWDAPDRPTAETRGRPTANERLAGVSLDDALAQEVPDLDPYVEAERTETGLVLDDDVAGIEEDESAAADANPGPRSAELVADDAGVVGDPLTARLVPAVGDGEVWPLAPEEDALHLD